MKDCIITIINLECIELILISWFSEFLLTREQSWLMRKVVKNTVDLYRFVLPQIVTIKNINDLIIDKLPLTILKIIQMKWTGIDNRQFMYFTYFMFLQLRACQTIYLVDCYAIILMRFLLQINCVIKLKNKKNTSFS